MRQKWSNMALGITCAMCICCAFLVFIVAIIYMSIYVILGSQYSPNENPTGCSRNDQIQGMRCSPNFEKLSIALEQLEQGYANPDRFQEVSKICWDALECINPIKCKTITSEYKFVKTSCVVFEMVAGKFNGCLKKLQNRFVYGHAPCLRPLLSTEELENKETCRMFEMYADCIKMEISEVCEDQNMYRELVAKILQLFECF